MSVGSFLPTCKYNHSGCIYLLRAVISTTRTMAFNLISFNAISKLDQTNHISLPLPSFVLRNTTYCSKVAFPLEVVQKDQFSCVSHSIKPTEQLFYLEYTNEKIICPDIDGFYPPSVTPTVNWYRVRKGALSLAGQRVVVLLVRKSQLHHPGHLRTRRQTSTPKLPAATQLKLAELLL